MKSVPNAALGILVAIIARPASAADVSNGERLAERWWAACHVVNLDQRQASSDAPPLRPNSAKRV
jgi:hypothetical protein